MKKTERMPTHLSSTPGRRSGLWRLWGRRRRALGVAGLIWLLTLAPLPWPVTPVMAATFTVTSTADNLTNGDGFCTLREAIRAANNAASNDCGSASSGNDTIVLQSGATYTLSLENSMTPLDEDTAAEDDLDIADASTAGTLTIQGNGATIQRDATLGCNLLNGTDDAGEFRIFEVLSGGNLTLQNVTVRNGCADGGFLSPDNDGGGIFVASGGTLTVTTSTISGNSARDDGGGIVNDGTGTVTITTSTISNNSAGGTGGGIDDDGGTVTIMSSTISGNSAGDGGGIYSNGGTVTITNSTISGNSAGLFGGGIDNIGTVTLTNSTISSNSATLFGGGILNESLVTITNSTISSNSATLFGGGIENIGGGIITGSTISNNSADEGGGIRNVGLVTLTTSTISNNSANFGGGILNGGTAMITGSTISGNSADDDGGGIANFGAVTLTNSTISGNRSGGGSSQDGGGIWNGGIGTVDASFVTIADNSAGASGQGGGIFVDSGTVNIKNSIVGDNTAGGGGPNCSGTLTPTGTNLATDASCTGFTQVPSTGAGGLNLGPLQVNAPGTTATHALGSGSAAIDAVTDCTDLQSPTPQPVTTDQRGVSRPQGSLCDAGAYETLRGVLLILQGDGHCLELDRNQGTYRFRSADGRNFTGEVGFLQRETILYFQSLRGQSPLLRGVVLTRRGVPRGVAVLSVPWLRRIFTIRDNDLADNPPVCPP